MNKPRPNKGKGKYIFLSYPHKNDEQAYEIIEALQAAGYHVWFDEGLELGTKYSQVIAEHIEECEVFMCLLTPGYYQSKYCRNEFNFAAEDCEKEIIPVYMGNDRQIKKSFPAGMRLFLSGINAFLMSEKVDLNVFMEKVKQTSMLEACREEKATVPETPIRNTVIPKETKKPIEVPKPVIVDRFESLRKAKAKDIVKLGKYPQGKNGEVAPIEWLVLDRQGDKILLISKYALDAKPYNEKWISITWEKCTLRKWLNEGFLQGAFDEEERRTIGVYSAPVPRNPEYSTGPGNATQDRVFLLSIEEARKYFGSDKERECKATDYTLSGIKRAYEKHGWDDFEKDYGNNPRCAWWLRSPGSDSGNAAVVRNGGGVYAYGFRVDVDLVGVRPALWLILNP